MTAASALAALVLVGTIAGVASDAAGAGPPLRPPAAGARPAGSETERNGPVWAWPLPPVPRVVHPFDPPPQPWNAGHRGIDLAPAGGGEVPVTAVDDGVVTHASVLAGRGTVTVLHAGDIKSTYEPLDITVAVGERVARGAPLGTLAAAGSHCAPARCLHLGGLRRDSAGAWNYFEPRFLLTSVEIVLLPTG